MYTITEETLEVILHYKRFKDENLKPSFTELNNMIKSIKNWENIRLEKELFQQILHYDMYATRVYIDDLFVGYIDKVNSPVINLFMDYTTTDLCVMYCKANPVYIDNKIRLINLCIKATTESKEFYDLVQYMKLLPEKELHNVHN